MRAALAVCLGVANILMGCETDEGETPFIDNGVGENQLEFGAAESLPGEQAPEAPEPGAPPVVSGQLGFEICGDGFDNDEDGLLDCTDPDCATSDSCLDKGPPCTGQRCAELECFGSQACTSPCFLFFNLQVAAWCGCTWGDDCPDPFKAGEASQYHLCRTSCESCLPNCANSGVCYGDVLASLPQPDYAIVHDYVICRATQCDKSMSDVACFSGPCSAEYNACWSVD